MEFHGKDVVKGCDFILVKIIGFASGITDEIEEELEECTLVIDLILLCKASVKDLENGLKSVLQEDVGVVACDQFVRNNDQLGVIFNVGGVD